MVHVPDLLIKAIANVLGVL